ncbi:hypothetical protein H5410_003191 [Solanum commersonii]|uniref:At2g35280-like TPR domain-containing protein n=1 Tax=Solanum commersonii TaxID=4109 RepID=A0A9J6B4F3_SOLCO|nr:hypothetical protein H5410_003191 [Solanum commersonii]
MWVPEPHLLGGRPICCTVHQFEQIDCRNVKFLPYTTVELLIEIIERVASYSFKDLMNVKLRVLNQVANEPSVYQKVTFVDFIEYIWPCKPCSVVRKCTSFLEMCRASRNLEALYRKGVVDYFHHSDPNGLEMLNQEADRGDIGASYVLAIISIFKGGEFMREVIRFIANIRKMKSLKLRRYRQKLRMHATSLDEGIVKMLIYDPLTCDSNVGTDDPYVTYETYVATNDLCVAINDPYVATYETYVATNDLSVATDASNVATYHPYVATFDHLRHMLKMTHTLLQMTHMLLHMRHMLLHITLM